MRGKMRRRSRRGGLLGGIERSNPNHEKKAERMLKVKDLTGAPVAVDPDAGMNRKERYEMKQIVSEEIMY